MTSLSPGATYHAQVREQLDQVGRVLGLQRALTWASRGLAVGLSVDVSIVALAWARGAVGEVPPVGAALLALALGLLGVCASLFVRQPHLELARRVDTAARLHERSVTALELGGRGEDHPLALAQLRDAAEHLKRLNHMDVFPFRVPRAELLASGIALLLLAALVATPNPWLIRARASGAASAVAQSQAQKIQKLADSLGAQGSPDAQQLRDLLNKSAASVQTHSDNLASALGDVEATEQQLAAMSAADGQLSQALGAIASALAADPASQPLANAIQSGDLQQMAQATQDLAAQASQLSPADKQQLAQTLRQAASAAQGSSSQLASSLNDAANALDASAAAQNAQDPATASQQASNASQALNDAATNTSDAAQRAQAAQQLQSSRNALERALGQAESRSPTANASSGSNSSSSPSQDAQGQDGQGQTPDQNASGSQSSGSSLDQGGASADQLTDANQSGNGAQGQGPGGDQPGGQGGQNGSGSGSGDQSATGDPGQLDSSHVVSPQLDASGNPAAPNQASTNPFLTDAGQGRSQVGDANVTPNYSNGATQASGNQNIPSGLRDLVKNYFSSSSPDQAQQSQP